MNEWVRASLNDRASYKGIEVGGGMIVLLVHRKFLLSLGVALLPLLVTLPLTASTVVNANVSELSRNAQWIGRVKIENSQTILVGGFPFTELSGTLQEPIKGTGEQGQLIRVRIPGGRKGTRIISVMGLASLRQGLEYLLFLDSSPVISTTALAAESTTGPTAQLVGWSVFQVTGQSSDRERFVVRGGESTLLRNTGSGMALAFERSSAVRYDDFLAEIFRSLD